MKKFFALVLALAMALSLTTVAWGADVTVTYDSTKTPEENGTALWTAVMNAADANGATVTVGPGTYKLGTNSTSRFTLDNKSVTIVGAGEGQTILEGNGYGIVLQDNTNPDSTTTFTLKNLTVKSTGTGTGIYVKYDVTVNLENVTIETVGDTAIGLDSANTIGGQYYDGIETVVNATNVTIADDDKVVMVANPASSTTPDAMTYASVNINGGCNFTAADCEPQNISQGLGNLEVNNAIINPGVAVVDGKHYATVQEAVTAAAASGSDVVLWPSTASSATIPDGYQSLKLTDGTYVVVPTVTFADKYDLYLADKTMNAMLALEKPAVSGLAFNEVGANTNLDGSGNVAYIVANNGEYYVKTTTPTTESYAVTYAGKTTVLYYVDVADVQNANAFAYAGSATAFDKFSTFDKCGYVTVAQMPAATDVYFQTAAGAALNVAYKAAATTGTDVTKNYLLDGEVVTIATTVPVVDHKFVASGYKYDTVKKINVPTSALCTKCLETSSVIYKDGKVPAGTKYYELWDGNNTTDYSVVATVAPVGGAVVTPSTDKTVTSADTFDAGIAMYVGMSVMAAAGSAVVLKKRED